MSKRKHTKPADKPAITQTPIADDAMFTPPIVAEASTDVDASENVVQSEPTTLTGPGSAGWPPADPQQLPVVEPDIDWTSRRISVGKLIAKHLRIPPASAQEQAAGLSQQQLTAIMAAQLAADPAELIRQIVG